MMIGSSTRFLAACWYMSLHAVCYPSPCDSLLNAGCLLSPPVVRSIRAWGVEGVSSTTNMSAMPAEGQVRRQGGTKDPPRLLENLKVKGVD